MKLAHIFADVPVGSVCTGTVAYYRLPIRKLLKAGVICEREHRVEGAAQVSVDYFFLGLKGGAK